MSLKDQITLDNRLMASLNQRGYSFPPGARVMPYTTYKDNQGVTHYQFNELARDAALLTAPNIGAPVQFYNFFDPEIINVMFAATNATQVLPEKKEGGWTDDYISFNVQEGTGYTSPYSDFTATGSSDVNFTHPSRQTYRYQTTIVYGDLESEKASAARISLVSQKQQQASLVMARDANRFYLHGVQGYSIYGLLNDPNLNEPLAPLSAILNGGSKLKWEDKAADTDNGATAIFNDILAMWAEISQANEGLVGTGLNDVVLAISHIMEPYLSATNKFGVTVKGMLAEAFKNRITFVTLPELSTAEGEQLMMICRNVPGIGDPGFLAFTEKLKMSDIQRVNNSYKQSLAAATAGAIITRPSLISTMTGI